MAASAKDGCPRRWAFCNAHPTSRRHAVNDVSTTLSLSDAIAQMVRKILILSKVDQKSLLVK